MMTEKNKILQAAIKPQKEGWIGESHWEDYSILNIHHDSLIETAGRFRESLNGEWNFTPDPYDTGFRMVWNRPEKMDDKGRSRPYDYDIAGVERVTVPSCWNLQKSEYFLYEGSGWYARAFEYIPKETEERVFIRIGAANYKAIVFLNGDYVGSHEGGSTPFFIEVTEEIKRKNRLQVCVNNMRSSDFVPMRNTDWFNYGGLYRDVELFRVPKVFIKSLKVHLIPDGKFNRITFKAELDGSIGNEPLTFSIPELGICEDVRPKDCIASVTVTANPELWTPDNPKLYKVTAEYGKDIVSDKIGFREIKTKGTEILLNGKSLFLRGICVHEDDAELGKTTNQEDIIRRFSHAKTLGCNFLRLAHYPHHEMVSQLADELGILLWEEIPVYWAINFTNKATYENAENQLLELINRDYNRASVILWSVGNENLDTEDRLKFMSKLAKAAKKSDPTRLISAACFVNKEERTIDDRLIEHLDIIGINEYYGWYIREYDEIKKIFAHAEVTKPVIITETGADALSGNHGTTEDLFTEEQMEEVYKNQVEIISKVDYIRGLTPWILYDFRSPRRQNYYQKGYNRKGLIAQDKKTPKLAFYILQEFYRSIQNKEENS